jgi:uncharacterized membrane protein YcaP (DUF421 family)
MFTLSIGVPELILRAVIVYFAIFLLLRLVGKKHVGELAPFDPVVLLTLSECALTKVRYAILDLHRLARPSLTSDRIELHRSRKWQPYRLAYGSEAA